MAEMRRVQLVENAKTKSHGIISSTFHFENKKYTLVGSQTLPVDLVVANLWVAADSNVKIMPER